MAEHVGLVEEGMFRPLGPNRGAEAVQLTADGMQVGRDVQPMDIADYEGLVVLVEGGSTRQRVALRCWRRRPGGAAPLIRPEADAKQYP